MPTTKEIADDKLIVATGRTKDQWYELLDQAGAKDWPHKDIARWLWENHPNKGWWCQMITVQYEYARGKRVVGETAAAGFEIGVTKTIKADPEQVWRFLTSPEGTKLWLGPTNKLEFVLNEPYRAGGTHGAIRTVKHGERIRLTYQPKGFKEPSTLQLTVTPRQSAHGTCIGFHQEKLANARVREQMRAHWQRVLDEIEQKLDGASR